MDTRMILIHAISPLHAGTGQSVGAIDLPIARERPTGIPLLPGSSIKGALRARSTDAQKIREVFGPETTDATDHAGSVQFSDAQLVLMPVRSVRGTFAWVTSPFLLRRFSRAAREAGFDLGPLPSAPTDQGCRVLSETLSVKVGEGRKVVFEDLDFEVDAVDEESHAPLRAFADTLGNILFPNTSPDFESWRGSLRDRICLIPDDLMSFLLETATEVNAHIRLDNDTKTVAQGALWYQESLPAEAVLAGIAVASAIKSAKGREERTSVYLLDHVASLADGLVQLGGKATIGQGTCFVRVAGGRP